MKTCTEIKFMILSSPNVETANKIIDDNYDFINFGEKIAFLKGMFDTEIIRKVENDCDETTYYSILNRIISASTSNLDNRAVKKTLSIPSWLNELAIENHINFSHLLQEALKEKLGLKWFKMRVSNNRNSHFVS